MDGRALGSGYGSANLCQSNLWYKNASYSCLKRPAIIFKAQVMLVQSIEVLNFVRVSTHRG
jgi:hypothetical protein